MLIITWLVHFFMSYHIDLAFEIIKHPMCIIFGMLVNGGNSHILWYIYLHITLGTFTCALWERIANTNQNLDKVLSYGSQWLSISCTASCDSDSTTRARRVNPLTDAHNNPHWWRRGHAHNAQQWRLSSKNASLIGACTMAWKWHYLTMLHTN